MRSRVFALKAISILATGSQLAGKPLWDWSIEDPVAFDAQQLRRLDVSQARQERGARIPAIVENDRTRPRSRLLGGTDCWLASSNGWISQRCCAMLSRNPRSWVSYMLALTLWW